MLRKLAAAAIAVTWLAGSGALAANLGEVVIKTVAAGAIVSAIAGPADKGINALTANNHLPTGAATKVVPVLSVGEKGYVGAAQVAGSKRLVARAKAVVQYETSFADKQYRIKLLIPMNSVNPIGIGRVRGLGVSALIDVALSSNAYRLPASAGWNAGDALKAGVIAVGVNQFGSQLNSFINSVYQSEGGGPDGVTKVVPYLSFGTKAYIGMMQIAGPASQVSKVRAVWQFEQLFDSGRVRLRALVPASSINPLSLKRVSGVGCTAVIDAMVLRVEDERRRPDHYRYFGSAPVFIGAYEDPHYRRPPGWDRGEKVGWAKHGNPYLPPGQAKKHRTPVITLPRIGGLVVGAREKSEGRARGRAKSKVRKDQANRHEDDESGTPGRAKGHDRGRGHHKDG
jgi:hypothetical protein